MKKLVSLFVMMMAIGIFTIGCNNASDPAPSTPPPVDSPDDGGAEPAPGEGVE